MNKKAQALNKKIEAGAIIVIIVVVLFLLYASLVPEAQKAGDSFNASNLCSQVGCFYNASLLDESPAVSTNACRQENASNTSNTCFASHTVPLSGLFRADGIVFLIIMVALLLIILKTVLPKSKKG